MTHPDDVTTGELSRRLDKVERTYLPQDLAMEMRRGDQQFMAGIQNDVKDIGDRMDKADAKRATDRRLWVGSLVFPLAVGVILLVLTALGNR